MKIRFLLLVLIPASISTAFTPSDRTPIEGTWIRKDDNLKIELTNDRATIVRESNEKFPCDVSSMFIYKDIRQVKTNQWSCHFLVVTMGSCIMGYETGELFIDKAGDLVVICPGYKSKVYQKAKPRYDSAP